MSALPGFEPIDAAALDLNFEAVPDDQITAGAPRAGVAELGAFSGLTIGVWERTAGGMRDIEVNEVFVVLAGEATVTLHVDGAESPRIELRPGVVCRLDAGSRTQWDVPTSLRKSYISAAEGD